MDGANVPSSLRDLADTVEYMIDAHRSAVKDAVSNISKLVKEKADAVIALAEEVDSHKRTKEALDVATHDRDTMAIMLGEEQRSLSSERVLVSTLRAEVARLAEEVAAFSKVSHIIAMEKENARLKGEVKALMERLSKPTPVLAPLPAAIAPKKDDSEPEEEYVQKKIKGTMFFVSTKDSVVYEDLDGEVGQRLGRLEHKKDGKLKVVWD